MKEKDKINLLKLLKRHISYKDGFWVHEGEHLVSEENVRNIIREQGIPILEKDITDLLSELSYNTIEDFNVAEYIMGRVYEMAQKSKGKSKYFESLDKIYPDNKFRQIMNYYLLSDDSYCFIIVGYGQTGKTTFVNIISKILGEEFFGRANVALLKNSHGLAVLEGKNFFEVAEAQDLNHDTANMLKSIITQDNIYVNPKFQLPRTIKPHVKMVMTCNSVPRFRITDDGIIRRFITINMNKKLPQNKNFLQEIQEDLPNIIKEAIDNPFKIEDFAEEQYEFFKNDAQYGFGYGYKSGEGFYGENDYDKYSNMCRAFGYSPRNKHNFDKFIELAKIYSERLKTCESISKNSLQNHGIIKLNIFDEEDLPF